MLRVPKISAEKQKKQWQKFRIIVEGKADPNHPKLFFIIILVQCEVFSRPENNPVGPLLFNGHFVKLSKSSYIQTSEDIFLHLIHYGHDLSLKYVALFGIN
jgi:hypothetical protein